MKTLTTLTITLTALVAIAACGNQIRKNTTRQQIATSSTTNTMPAPAPAPVGTPPDTAQPIVPLTEPSTTLPTKPKPAPTTLPPEPEPPAQTPLPNTTSSVSLDDPDMPTWRAIARCEMPGPGGVPSEPWGVHWSFKAKFSGAFGVYNGTWLAADGGKYGPTAGHATWQQQIEIARNIRDRWGYRAWGCARKLGIQ